MKTINVFLASSEELRIERNEFSDLILQLNDLFERRSIRLRLVRWEHLDSSMGVEHKQHEYNDRLRECELCLVLYWTRFGEYTHSELETAYSELKAGRNPRKLYVFFKDTDQITPELQQFRDGFASKYGHFYCRFENVDTMRLHFLLQLEAYQNSGTQEPLLTLEKGKVRIDGQPFADLENIRFANRNEAFQRMKTQLAQLNGDLAEMRAAQVAAPDDEDLWEKAMNLAAERKKLADEFEQYQGYLLGMAVQFARLAAEGCTERTARARELFEQGRASEANEVLNAEQMQRDAQRNVECWEQAQRLAEEYRQGVLASISEFRLKTSTAMSDTRLSLPERFAQASEAYEQAIALARKVGYDQAELANTLFGYARLCENFNNFERGVALYEEALVIYRQLGDDFLFDRMSTLNSLGILHLSQNQHQQAKAETNEALAIISKLADADPDSYQSDLAAVHNNMGHLHSKEHQFLQASLEYEAAMSIMTPLCQADPSKHSITIIRIINNLATTYIHTERFKMAKSLLGMGLTLVRSMMAKDTQKYLPDAAILLINMGIVHQSLDEYPQAESVSAEALKIHRGLAAENPDLYLPKVAHTLNLIGITHTDDHPDKAEAEFGEALKIYQKLAGSDPDVYRSQLAYTRWLMGRMHTETDPNRSLAELYEALDLYQGLAAISTDNYSHEVAMVYRDISMTYVEMDQPEKSHNECLRGLAIHRELAARNPRAYRPHLAEGLNMLGILECYLEDYTSAVETLRESVEIYSKIAHGSHYADKLAEAQQNLQDAIDQQNQQ